MSLMCDSDDASLPVIIRWLGWETTLGHLQENGWAVERGVRRGRGTIPAPQVHWIKITHRHSCVTGYAEKNQTDKSIVWQMQNMVHRKLFKRKPPRLTIQDEVTLEDVPEMYRIILELQAAQPKAAPKPLSIADVIVLKERA